MKRLRPIFAVIVLPLMILAGVLGLWPARPVWAAPPSRPLYATCVVTTTADSGPGSLRQCMLNAGSGDTIVFNPTVFPASSPATIALATALPEITQGHLTVDGSSAGVILDGSACPNSWDDGFHISSDGNWIKGLQILNFREAGVTITDGASQNTIENNVISGNSWSGIAIHGSNTISNTVIGNLIGTDASGMVAMGNGEFGLAILLAACRRGKNYSSQPANNELMLRS